MNVKKYMNVKSHEVTALNCEVLKGQLKLIPDCKGPHYVKKMNLAIITLK